MCRSPLLYGSWPPSLMLVAVVMNRPVKSSRCSHLPLSMSRLTPASVGVRYSSLGRAAAGLRPDLRLALGNVGPDHRTGHVRQHPLAAERRCYFQHSRAGCCMRWPAMMIWMRPAAAIPGAGRARMIALTGCRMGGIG
jgi:hypothetical protein